MVQIKYIIILFLLTLTFKVFSQKFTISGYVKDVETGESLIGANVYEQATIIGTSSNNYGFFSLALPSDTIVIIISYVGYGTKKMAFNLQDDMELTIELSPSEMLEEVIVTAGEAIEQTTEMSIVRLPIRQIKSLPAFMGETDVMKALQLLPGVQSGVEGSSGVYVRGGGPDQNLILLDGVPVYNASHLFGAFSVFNADAINNIELIKGGFPARYGGRLSSVIDITMREGNSKALKVNGSIGLISSQLTMEGPIKNEKTTFILSGRRTYLDILTRPILKIATKGREKAGYYFYDLNFKINHTFSNKDRIYLSTYMGQDKASSTSEWKNESPSFKQLSKEKYGLDWGNITTSFRWNHLFTPKLFSNTTINYSRYRFSIFEGFKRTYIDQGENLTEEGAMQYFSGIEDFSTKMDFDFSPNASHSIKFGFNAVHHTFNPGVSATQSGNELDTVMEAGKIYALEGAAYVEDDFRINDKFKANLGLHASGFLVNGQSYYSLQPRVALRYLLNANTSLKASYGDMTQYIHLLTNSGIGLPTDLWVPATDNVLPQQSRQAAVGLAKTLKNNFEVSVEGYYKTMDNLIEYKEGASFMNIDTNWEEKIERGSGVAYGGEFFVRKNTGKLTGWVGYTLSKSDRQFDNLNFGEKYPYKYDRRHDVSIVGVYKINDRIELSGSWVFGTGNALSIPIATYKETTGSYWWNESVNYYSGRNDFRMKPYHRLDLGISFKKQKKWGIRTWSFSIYNVYSRKNPFFIEIGQRDNKQEFIQYSLFPIIPSFSYKFNFIKND